MLMERSNRERVSTVTRGSRGELLELCPCEARGMGSSALVKVLVFDGSPEVLFQGKRSRPWG